MASKDKSIKRGVELYIDGKEIKKDIASIEREARALTKEIRRMEIGTEEYRASTKRLRELNGVLAEHRAEMRAVHTEQKGMLASMNDWLGKWGALMATATAGEAAFGMVVMKYRKDLNEREDTRAGVKALTGLDDESIEWLENVAKELSTTMTQEGIRIRQSATEILDAFRLVGSAKPELLQDKEALAEVTKQAMILSQASGIELKQAVDAVTLSMNQYGATANEAARYANVMAAGSKFGAAAVDAVTVAVKKSGVAASTAGVPIEQLVGTIEALAEKGIKDDIAGTGLKSFFLKLEKQADDVRPSVVGLQTALENLAAKNLTTSQMIKMFGLDTYTVAQAVITSADKVKYYSDVVSGTETATEQAAVMSETAAAKLAQLKNEFMENGMVLAQQLAPIISKFMNITKKVIQALPVVFKWIKENKTEIISVGLAIVALTAKAKVLALTTKVWAAMKAAVVAFRSAMVLTTDAMVGCSMACTRLTALMKAQNVVTKLVTGTVVLLRAAYAAITLNVKEASRAMAAFNSFIKINPYVAVVSVITSIGYAFAKVHQSVDMAAKRMKEYKRIQDEAAASVDNERMNIERLNKIIHDSSASYDDRKKAIEDMQSIIPEYHASLTTEGNLINDNVDAISAYIRMLTLQAEAEAATAKLVEAKAQKQAWLRENEERAYQARMAQRKYDEQHRAFFAPEAGEKIYSSPEEAAMDMFGLTPTVFRVLQENMEELQGEVDMYQKIIDDIEDKMKQVKSSTASAPGGAGDNNGNTQEEKEKKKVREALLAVDAEYDKKAAELKRAYIHGEIESEQEYTDQLASLEMDRLKAKMKVAGLEEAQRAEFLDRIMSAEVKLRQKLDAMILRRSELTYEEQLQRLEDSLKKQKIFIEDLYNMGIIPTEEKKNEYLLAIADNYRIEKQKILDKQAEDEEKARRKEAEAARRAAEEERKAYEKEAEKIKSFAVEISDIFSEIGENLAEALFGDDKKEAWKKMGKEFLKDALAIVEKYILIKQAQIMADAIASASTIAAAAPAIAKAAAKMAGIKAAFGLAKGAINSFDTGGFTGKGKWDEPKGIVHANEFVANRHATANPNVMPVLSLIDAAQRSGSISHLTGDDIAAVAGRVRGTQVNIAPAPSDASARDNAALITMMARMEQLIIKAEKAYEKPSQAYVYVKGKGGIEEAENLASVMIKNSSR